MGIKTAIEAMDCPQKISPDKYEAFAKEWLDNFHTSGWEWSWLSPTVHMLFHHGAQIFRTLPVSPSLLTGHVTLTEINTLLILLGNQIKWKLTFLNRHQYFSSKYVYL